MGDPDQGGLLFQSYLAKLLFPFALWWISTKVLGKKKKKWVNILGAVVIFCLFQFSSTTVRTQEGRDYYLVTICWYVFFR